MMEFLKPPTDNLYKFMTLCGLVLLLVSITYPPWLLTKVVPAYYETLRDYDLLEIDREELEAKRDAFKLEIDKQNGENVDIDRQISELMKRANQDISKAERAKISAEAGRLEVKFDERSKKVHEPYDVYLAASTDVRRKSTELQYKLRLSLWQHRGAQTASVLSLIGAVVGLLLGILGFNAWSLRVEVYHDAILRKQAALESEGEEADAPKS